MQNSTKWEVFALIVVLIATVAIYTPSVASTSLIRLVPALLALGATFVGATRFIDKWYSGDVVGVFATVFIVLLTAVNVIFLQVLR